MPTKATPTDPCIQIIPTLGPKVCKYYLHWAIWIPRVLVHLPFKEALTVVILELRVPIESARSVVERLHKYKRTTLSKPYVSCIMMVTGTVNMPRPDIGKYL